MMRLSVIIPVYNEKATIEKLVHAVHSVEMAKEIIVVDDGSNDGTRELLGALSIDGMKRCFHRENRGKGAAIRTGLQEVTGDIVIIQDGDLEYNPQEYHRLVEPIVEGKAAVVYGSRLLGLPPRKKVRYHFYYPFALGVKLLNLMTRLLYGQRVTDEATCYKVFRTDVIQNINLK